jgi:hypothetical protein
VMTPRRRGHPGIRQSNGKRQKQIPAG